MPKFLFNRWHGLHMIWMFVLTLALSVGLFIYTFWLGLGALLLCGLLAIYTIKAERAFRKELNKYIGTLSYRVKKVNQHILQELPTGIVLYDEKKVILWHNPLIGRLAERQSVIGQSLADIFPALKNKKENKVEFKVGKHIYQAQFKPEEGIVFFHDITSHADLIRRYQEEKTAMGAVLLDNLDEATQGMDDQTRSIMLAKITGIINAWAQKFGIYLRRTATDRYIILMDQKGLSKLEASRFEILDEVRELTAECKVPLTLSIGIASGVDTFVELGQMVQVSLDIALGRGGDQVAVKVGQRLSFYGGKSNAVEKRTRVRARVVSHALRDLMKESDKVIIMGHKIPDMDAIGAAIGVLKAAQMIQKEAYIVLEGVNPSIQKLMGIIMEDERLYRWFIPTEQALQLVTSRTLLVVVDTHKASLVAEPKLLNQSQRLVVVDHHRRGEEFLSDALLIYMEPYASSTCELVTELLQYFHDRMQLGVLEATSMLAGITVDTKNFSMRTGSRTFEAASYLRRNGADPGIIQKLLKEDLAAYIQKADILKHAIMMYDRIAIAVAPAGQKYSQLLIAQVADTLLNMTGVQASFVVSERNDGKIGISARSLGQMNVQLVMERLGGGGHLTNAAVQLEGSLQAAADQLKATLDEMKSEEELFE